MRRVKPKNRDDRQRILTCIGRADDLVSELVIELDAASGAYIGKGDRQHTTISGIKETVALILPHDRPGFDFDSIKAAWPIDQFPRKSAVLDALTEGFGSGAWMRDGTGKKGNPYKYWVNDNSVSVPDPPGNQKTELPKQDSVSVPPVCNTGNRNRIRIAQHSEAVAQALRGIARTPRQTD
jgi:hypothetical protein